MARHKRRGLDADPERDVLVDEAVEVIRNVLDIHPRRPGRCACRRC